MLGMRLEGWPPIGLSHREEVSDPRARIDEPESQEDLARSAREAVELSQPGVPVAPLSAAVSPDSDEIADFAEFVMNEAPHGLMADYAHETARQLPDSRFVLVAVSPSGALRTAGHALHSADGRLELRPDNYWCLMDTEDKVPVSDDSNCRIKTALLL
jgi:hypothetical protein